MFTGLIEKIGKIRRISRGAGLVLEIEAETPWHPSLEDGESISVNGVCLTVAKHDATRFTADVLRETENRSTLGEIAPGAYVNLERAMRVGDRFGGHVVQGHVDGVGALVSRTARGRDFALRFQCGRAIAAASVMKGSIAVNGVSLTISGLGNDWLEVNIIPVTAKETNLGRLICGDRVNLESDVLGRYAIRHAELSASQESDTAVTTGSTGLTWDKLAENGFL